MATTTNYGWTTPDDTSLVSQGAAAIRSLGSSIDTTTKNLNPSTTLGDIEYRSSTANTNTRLAIGTTGQVLTVSGGVPSWATPSSPSVSFTTAYAYTSGTESTSASTYTDLTTVTSVTLTTGTKALVIVAAMAESYSAFGSYVSFAISGSTTVSASDEWAFWNYSSSGDDKSRACMTRLVTGLTAGSNTFTMKFRTTAGGGRDFSHRSITVIDMGS